MRLSQLFSGETRTEGTTPPQPTPAQTEHLNRQIRSLTPGQTISGEIVGRNGSEVQIRLSEDMILNARVDRNLNIEIGKNMTFEVKNNGSTLTLSPLFTNVATDVNVMKALNMAGLPVNQTTVSMTGMLMAEGMSVNKNSLQQIFRELTAFPQANIEDIINLHKLQLPVNEANLTQMASYRNLTHQLTGGMEAIQEAMPEVFDSMIAEGDISGAVKLYQEVLQLLQGEEGTPLSQEAPLGPEAMSGQETVAQTEGIVEEGRLMAAAEDVPENGTEGKITGENRGEAIPSPAERPADGREQTLPFTGELQGEAHVGNGPVLPEGAGADNAMSDALRGNLARQVLEVLNQAPLPEETAAAIREQVMQFGRGQGDIQQLFTAFQSLADVAKFSAVSAQGLEKLFSGREFRTLMASRLKNSWTIRPEELTAPGKVEELYRRMDRQLKSLANVLEDAGQTNSTAFKTVTSMSQNVDFLQQVNQMYAYVQLPLRLQQGNGHGELYVYTNKKKLTAGDGTVSALLHLDMEHLGPIDVHVALKDSKVSTRFYLRDEEMIDFLAGHMDVLTKRLQKRGYDCSFSMTVREKAAEEEQKGGLEPVLRQEKGIVLSHYAFDVRT